MANENMAIDLLLVSESPARAQFIEQFLNSRQIKFVIRRVSPGKAAVSYARRSGNYKDAAEPDLVLFDYYEPLKGGMAMLRTLSLGRCRACAPVVVLSGPETEHVIEDANRNCEEAMMFSPVGLAAFIDRLGEHGKQRFLKAARIMSELGPLLVRLPDYFKRQPDDVSRLIA